MMEIYEKQIILPVFITQSMMGTVGQTSEQLKTKKKGRKSGSSQLFSAKDNLANRCMFIKVYLLVISLFTCVFFSCSVLSSLSHRTVLQAASAYVHRSSQECSRVELFHHDLL